MKMKKMMFLMLTLFILGAVSMNAQVRIGGEIDPADGAVLDLNPNNNASNAATSVGGLSLTRVALTSVSQQLSGSNPQPGTIVYNTGAGLEGAGLYVWTTQWTKVIGSGSALTAISVDNASKNVALTKTGTTAVTLSANVINGGIDSAQIKANAVRTSHINNLAVTMAKVAANAIDSTKIKDGTVTTADLRNTAVTSAKIADNAVSWAKIAPGAVSQSKLADLEGATVLTTFAWNGTAWGTAAVLRKTSYPVNKMLAGNSYMDITNSAITGSEVCSAHYGPFVVSPYLGGVMVYNPSNTGVTITNYNCIQWVPIN
ncbi:hypothetical protein FACS189437_06130 [Bacteroidia bacterium]|nr:hypothetical protein FACS189437_06130 [Bacteroidia bacterium]